MSSIGRTLSLFRVSAKAALVGRFESRFRSADSPYLAVLRNLADAHISLISHSYLY